MAVMREERRHIRSVAGLFLRACNGATWMMKSLGVVPEYFAGTG
jgi:hypothetical protein